jgi:hypothetical protein
MKWGGGLKKVTGCAVRWGLPLPTTMIYSAADIHNYGAYVQFGEIGYLIRCSQIESIKVRRFPTEGTIDMTLRMTSGHKFRYTVRSDCVLEVIEKLNGA